MSLPIAQMHAKELEPLPSSTFCSLIISIGDCQRLSKLNSVIGIRYGEQDSDSKIFETYEVSGIHIKDRKSEGCYSIPLVEHLQVEGLLHGEWPGL